MDEGSRLDDEDSLWTLLRFAAGDPVPDEVRRAAWLSLAWRDPDSALAALVADSDVDGERLVHVRGRGQARLLTFAAAALTIEVEAVRTRGTLALIGQLVPASVAVIAVDHRGGMTEAYADAVGRFHVAGLPTGPVRIRCALPDRSPPTRTDWFLG